MTDVVLRQMRWWDVEPCHELEVELFPVDAWSVELFWSELAGVPETRHYVVAVDGDDVLGYAGLMAVADHADVQTVAVRPTSQGHGIGRRLLETLLAEAARRGCREVMLEVAHDNERAQRLYDGFGFERIARRRDYYAPGVDAVVMRRRLHEEVST